LGSLGSWYQRAGERRGTYWFDVDRLADAPFPEPEQVRTAASNAIAALKAESSPGRRPDKVIEFLADKFREIFLRFNKVIFRHSVLNSRDGRELQVEGGPFVEFLEEALRPLNRYFDDLEERQVSAGAIAEFLRDRRRQREQDVPRQTSLGQMPDSPNKFHREFRSRLVFDCRVPNAGNGVKTRF
jgi:hypothetical protein